MQWSDLALRVPFAGGSNKRIAFGKELDAPDQVATFAASDQPVMQAQTQIRTCVIDAAGKEAGKSKEAAGWVDVSGSAGGLTLSVVEMAGQFPNALEVREGEVIFHGFSSQAGHNLGFRNRDVHERLGEEVWTAFNKGRGGYQAMEDRYSNGKGLAKTHELVLSFRPRAGERPDSQAAGLALQPPIALATPKWNCDSLAFGPYHPVDRENFPQLEAKLDKAFDDWLHAINHMEPHYGFYDHGRGVPHHMKKSPTPAPDGEDVYVSDGYRRNYDLGYGNAISPWLGFLRGGDRRWLIIGENMARHEMDVRHVHPTDTPGKFKVGSKYWHYGWWSFDGSSCAFSADSWYKGLALCFYTTGYQRAMDVYNEIMDGIHHEMLVAKTIKAGEPDYTFRTTIAGSAAIFYAATWNPKYRELVEAIVPGMPKLLLADGRVNVRQEWVAYGFFETTHNMPQPPAVIAEPYRRFQLAHVRVPERVFMWEYGPHNLWSYYQRTKDPQIGLLARHALDRFENYYGIGYLGFDNIDRLWKIPVYMNLALVPNGDQAVPYSHKDVAYPQYEPIFIKHEKGKPTVVEFVYKQLPEIEAFDPKMLQAFDEKGQPVSKPIFSLDSDVLVFDLKVPADAPSQLYRIRATLPPNRSLWNYDEALTMPWQPDAYPLTMKWRGDSPIVPDPAPASRERWVFSDANEKFPVGKFGRGVRVSKDRGVKIPLGAAAEAPWSKQFFNGQRGTLEFWVRFERPTLDGGFGGTLVSLPSKGSPAIHLSCAESWQCSLGNVEKNPVRPIYDLHPEIEPGRWYHLAIIWDHSVGGQGRRQVLNRVFLDGIPAPTVQTSDKLDYMPTAFDLNEVLGPLMIGGMEGGSFATIDELRVSSEPRYPRGWIKERAFVPPDKPFEFDDNTLLLVHFEDDQAQGARAGSAKLEMTGF
jgi:hypothetical protein